MMMTSIWVYRCIAWHGIGASWLGMFMGPGQARYILERRPWGRDPTQPFKGSIGFGLVTRQTALYRLTHSIGIGTGIGIISLRKCRIYLNLPRFRFANK
ncbi:uncharacterized protein F4817DRAFT_166185 [Daldinia loculata]|uniref:uncharacterized protein n=1 Tax=Daldinia loculata TaxID=103429 RepID=UPI0020C57F61|nr:uncharacterized protein F4817DRAFT_166185 [Daldinia loculata]KAI1645693.1 hypothetical protein F4817DRAFT_166185 [Daldinia loculata]